MLASNMDCNQKSKEDMLSCMQSKSLEEIYSASDLGFSNAPYEGPLIWASVVDGDFVSDPFFPQEAQCSKKWKDFITYESRAIFLYKWAVLFALKGGIKNCF